MDDATREELLERYRAGARTLAEALEGATEAELDARPAPGEWSARQVVHHVADAELRSALRLRQLLAEDSPTIQGYDESDYAERLHYDRPIEASLAAIRAARDTSAELLERMTEDDWKREGTHTENGRYTPETWLEIYAAHCLEHAAQIREARAANG